MKIKETVVKMICILAVLAFTLLTACSDSSGSESSEQSSQSSQEPEKVPSDLTGFESNIETIVRDLDGPAAQEQQGNQSSQQGQSQQQSQVSSATRQDPMDKISPIVDKMHYQWNNLMPLAIKKGAGKDLVNNFDNALNQLSSAAIGKNKMNTLMAANNLYAYIPDLYSLFKPSSSAIKRIRYYSRSSILNSLNANWSQADSDIGNLKSAWTLYKNTLGKDQQDAANKLDLSIYELEKVIKERNQPLVNIKGKVELSNIDALEKATGGQSESSLPESQASSEQSGSQQSSSEQSSSQQSSSGQSSSQQSSSEQSSSQQSSSEQSSSQQSSSGQSSSQQPSSGQSSSQ